MVKTKPKLRLVDVKKDKKPYVYPTGLTDQQIEERAIKTKKRCALYGKRKDVSYKYVWLHIYQTTWEVDSW